ncbi:MAG: hypothetical protein JWO91_544 [Acidobacteriaceae bacterium]|nr:hypothetical protein [Acidobacteriaceae bacterium]
MKIDFRVLLIRNLLGFAALVSPAIGQTAHDPAMHPYRRATTTKPNQQKLSQTYKAPKLSVTPRHKDTAMPAAAGGKRSASDAQVAALERETAKTQTAKPTQKAAVAPRPVPGPKADPAEKNKPMNFSYQTPKNNASAGTTTRPKRPH